MFVDDMLREMGTGKDVIYELMLNDSPQLAKLMFKKFPLIRRITDHIPTTNAHYNRDSENGKPKVFLKHGFLTGASSMKGISAALEDYGINNRQYNFMRGLWVLTDELIAEIKEEVRLTGKKIDYVGHSKGGLMGIIASMEHPELFNKVVTLATPFYGSRWALAFMGIKPLRQMWSGNKRLEKVYKNSLPGEVQYLNMYSLSDPIINPSENAILPNRENVTNIEIKGIGHNRMLYDRRVFFYTRNFLDDKELDTDLEHYLTERGFFSIENLSIPFFKELDDLVLKYLSGVSSLPERLVKRVRSF